MKRSKAFLFWLTVAVLAMACVPLGAAPTKGGDLVYGTWQSPDNLDVQVSGLQITWNIAVQVFDPLVRRMPG
jgi:ABC-type transport system substrate-binding protein